MEKNNQYEDENGNLNDGVSKVTIYAFINSDDKLEIHIGHCSLYLPPSDETEDSLVVDDAARFLMGLITLIKSKDRDFPAEIIQIMDDLFDKTNNEFSKEKNDITSYLIKESLKKK